jgi:hypothetical protein
VASPPGPARATAADCHAAANRTYRARRKAELALLRERVKRESLRIQAGKYACDG